jgi:CheY-like chemotaxis protein
MHHKTRILNVRVVGFSAPERQMLNSIFLLSVAPARQIGYKLWVAESGVAPDMYLLDGDSDSAVASWQATFSSTSDRTLVVGAKNTDLGVASAARPLGLKVVGAMDRLAIALNNVERESAAALDVSAPRAGGTLPAASTTLDSSASSPTSSSARFDASLSARVNTAATAQQPALSTSINTAVPAAAASLTAASQTAGAAAGAAAGASASASATLSTASTSASMIKQAATAKLSGTLPTSMTANAPAATVLPSVTLAPNVVPQLDANDKSISEKPVTEKTVDRILSDGTATGTDRSGSTGVTPAPSGLAHMSSGVTPLSPAALSAVVNSTSRTNLRVVPPPSPLAASLPTAASTARIAEAPMQPPPTVQVTPPAAATPSPAPAPATPASPGVSSTRQEEQAFRVLCVDDSPLMRTFLQNKLQPYGIQPEFAASGEEALFKISKQHNAKQPYDLVFLDVMLPGMDGYDVCKMIKKNKDNAPMKVVMLTSKDKTFDKIRGTMAGCDGYLTKPVDELKLRAIIERHSVSR